MLPFTFLYPLVLALAVVAIPLVLWLRKKRQAALAHPQVGMHTNLKGIPLVGRLPGFFLAVAIALIVAALANPVVPESKTTETMQTREIVVAVDMSGSMFSGVFAPEPPAGSVGVRYDKDGKPQEYQPIDAAVDATYSFALKRMENKTGDRIALFVFDDDTYWHWPLTDDLEIVLRKSKLLNARSGGGTNFEGPTASDPKSGPFQAGIVHIREFGKAKSRVLIVVSDGESNVSEQRMQEIVAQLRDLNMRVYLLGVGSSYTAGTENSSNASVRELLRRIGDAGLGGRIFAVGNAANMRVAFDTINGLEKSTVEKETTVTFKPIYPVFVLFAGVLLLLFFVTVPLTRQVA
jgi:Ca-activated chloride channel family protein